MEKKKNIALPSRIIQSFNERNAQETTMYLIGQSADILYSCTDEQFLEYFNWVDVYLNEYSEENTTHLIRLNADVQAVVQAVMDRSNELGISPRNGLKYPKKAAYEVIQDMVTLGAYLLWKNEEYDLPCSLTNMGIVSAMIEEDMNLFRAKVRKELELGIITSGDVEFYAGKMNTIFNAELIGNG